ncbi:type IA DNA topoisomerase [Aureibacter tunicatorum]|uniref:DNA topoisomerase n=1 Tax=Aureibacter tunicatorum TaxID=866807 RepID=A0AAE3XLZ6_9BACT|nr:DNA topoisomerase 3 [Aureibacter tunicatorum]MDR6240366.1 DNA topoisomerase-3 [Aureibacter tunicatorum]BDD05753.1 DNA topoisomerase III [Aureibacter tunicatorum]
MKVCIAEKPSVAKEIAQIIGAKQRNDGYFEGNGYQVTWTFGHLCTLKEPHDYLPILKSWSLQMLPILPERFGIKLIDDGGIKKQFKTIEKLLSTAKLVINCGDAGQEGELIQQWVIKKAKYKGEIKRLWISSLTKEAIQNGFNKLYSNSDFANLYAAGSTRAIGDWLLGINATRAYTLKYGDGKGVLSIGRVQTPTLALIVKRQKEIENFTPEPYWELKTKYRDVAFSSETKRYSSKESVESIVNEIKNSELTIVSFKKQNGKELPPSLFDLTSLQVECNKKLSFSADQTLKIVQSLYEKKFVTYPRVDTTFLPDDIYPQVSYILKSMERFQHLTQPLLGKKIRKSKKVFNNQKVTDHHAIIPTQVTARGLNNQEQSVYDIIAKRFIAVFYDDCLVSKTEVKSEVEKHKFKATGKQILSMGWREVYADEKNWKSASKEDEQVMPVFKEGESGPHLPYFEEKMTKPPKYYTEASLLRAMETADKEVDDEELRNVLKQNGIGRPSTRASIIETLHKRRYITKQKKRLEATSVGTQLIDTINSDLLKSVELTGQWEHKLRQIEDGKLSPNSFLKEMKEMVSNIIGDVKNASSQKILQSQHNNSPKKPSKAPEKKANLCPKCGKGKVLTGKSAYGCSEWKQGCDFRLPLSWNEIKISQSMMEALVKKGKSRLIKNASINGKKQNGHLIIDKNTNLSFETVEEKKMTCPKCSSELLKGKNAFGCSSWKQGCHFKIPFEWNGKKFTQAQIYRLIEKRETTLIKGFTDPVSSEKYNAVIQLNATNQIGEVRKK